MPLRSKKSLIDQTVDAAKAVVPAVEAAVESLIDSAKEGVETAKEVVATTTASVAESPVVESATGVDSSGSRRGRWKRLLLIGGLLALGGAVLARLRQRAESDNWQSSYVPTPPPSAPTSPETTDGATAGAAADQAEDPAGASPDEAAADATAEPHEPSTPDAPSEVVEVDTPAEDSRGSA